MSNEPTPPRRQITIEVTEVEFQLLGVVAGGCMLHCAEHKDKTEAVRCLIEQLIDHAQQGVYRPGAWERMWLAQAFGDDWVKDLEPGDPHGRPGCESIFQKPKGYRPEKEGQ